VTPFSVSVAVFVGFCVGVVAGYLVSWSVLVHAVDTSVEDGL